MEARECPENRGVNVKIQEDQVGKDVSNGTHSLRAGPERGAAGWDRSVYSWEEEKGRRKPRCQP